MIYCEAAPEKILLIFKTSTGLALYHIKCSKLHEILITKWFHAVCVIMCFMKIYCWLKSVPIQYCVTLFI